METTSDDRLRKLATAYQRAEVTGYIIYNHMAAREKGQNAAVLARIARDENEHAAVWKRHSGRKVRPNWLRIIFFTILSYLFGYTFVIKLMEIDENNTVKAYEDLKGQIPEIDAIIVQEDAHENFLQGMLDEERLRYVGAMVLGLNDALVELTGTIAGLTFALANNRLVALAGIITGVSATLSMAASNYLAERADGKVDAFKSCVYTGVAYLVTVVALVLPYLLFPAQMYLAALLTMLMVVVLIVFFFNYYIAVAKSLPFWRRFGEMACISLGVAVISFVIGLAAKRFLGIEM